MLTLNDEQFRLIANEYIDAAREDFEPSFSLTDFLRYVRLRCRGEYWTDEQEGLALKLFDSHYDLSRSSIGSAKWSFIPEYEAQGDL